MLVVNYDNGQDVLEKGCAIVILPLEQTQLWGRTIKSFLSMKWNGTPWVDTLEKICNHQFSCTWCTYYFLSANILVSAIRCGACDSLCFGIPHVQVSQFISGTLQCYLICCFVDNEINHVWLYGIRCRSLLCTFTWFASLLFAEMVQEWCSVKWLTLKLGFNLKMLTVLEKKVFSPCFT